MTLFPPRALLLSSFRADYAVFGILAVLRYQIIVIPTILQEGISLFGKQPEEIVLRLVGTTDYTGMAALLYEPRPIETKNVP